MTWRDMSSAPKDSQLVLLSVPRIGFTGGTPQSSVGYWDGATWQFVVALTADPHIECVDPDGWLPIPKPRLSRLEAVLQDKPQVDLRPRRMPPTADEVVRAEKEKRADEALDRRIRAAVNGSDPEAA